MELEALKIRYYTMPGNRLFKDDYDVIFQPRKDAEINGSNGNKMRIVTNLILAAGLALASCSMASGARAAAPAFDPAEPTEGIGQPTGGMGLPVQVTEVGEHALWFHDALLLPVITAISLLVLGLLLWVITRFNRRTNPEPSKTTHNTMLEVIWTLVPALTLLFIAVPSIGLLQAQYNLPEGDTVTVKVTGSQWNWTYEYPDHGDILLVSNILAEEGEQQEGQRFRTDADGPRLLAVDQRLVIPAGVNVRFLITASDVIHSFAVPAFWLKMDAVPGRLNETWTRVEREGVYFGQCSELCGARHGFMPIAVEVVSPEEFEQWVIAQGGSMPGSEAEVVEAADDAHSEMAAVDSATAAS